MIYSISQNQREKEIIKLKKLLTLVLSSLLLVGCTSSTKKTETAVSKETTTHTETVKEKVYVTTNVFEQLTKEIVKEDLEVVNLLGNSTDPHHFELTPKDLANLKDAKVLVINGFGLEHWVEDALETGTLTVEKIADGSVLLPYHIHTDSETHHHNEMTLYEEEHSEHEEEHHHHHHGDIDPHYWMAPTLVQLSAVHISNVLGSHYEELDARFTENLSMYITNDFGKVLEDYEQLRDVKHLFSVENILSYLGEEYEIEVVSLLNSHEEPTAEQLTEFVKEFKEHNGTHIYTSTLESQTVLKLKEVLPDAQFVKIHSFESLSKEDKAKSLVDLYTENLQAFLMSK